MKEMVYCMHKDILGVQQCKQKLGTLGIYFILYHIDSIQGEDNRKTS